MANGVTKVLLRIVVVTFTQLITNLMNAATLCLFWICHFLAAQVEVAFNHDLRLSGRYEIGDAGGGIAFADPLGALMLELDLDSSRLGSHQGFPFV